MKLDETYYTCDIANTYWYVKPISYKEDYTEATVIMYYKFGEYKDTIVSKDKWKLYHKNITHWYEYDPKKMLTSVIKCGKIIIGRSFYD